MIIILKDRRVRAEKAWAIPYKFSQEIGTFDFLDLLELGLGQTIEIFERNNLHRHNKVMGEYFFLGIEKIHNEYNDDASSIWKDNPGSVTVIRRFLSFKGVGPKIATMAANMLVRDFKVQMKDKYFIDVSPDVQLRRVFQRLGFIIKGAAILDLI